MYENVSQIGFLYSEDEDMVIRLDKIDCVYVKDRIIFVIVNNHYHAIYTMIGKTEVINCSTLINDIIEHIKYNNQSDFKIKAWLIKLEEQK